MKIIGSGADLYPFFSPDGEWIIYASERDGLKDETPLNPVFSSYPGRNLYAVGLKDRVSVRITDDKWEDIFPFWSIK